MDLLLNSVSMRSYEKMIPAMADTVGVSKSSVSGFRALGAGAVRSAADFLTSVATAGSPLVRYLLSVHLTEADWRGRIKNDAKGRQHRRSVRSGCCLSLRAGSRVLRPRSDMTLLIRAPEGLQPS